MNPRHTFPFFAGAIPALAMVLLLSSAGIIPKGSAPSASPYPISPVPFTSVKVSDSFWADRLETSRKVTVPLAFSKCEETGRYDNFVKAARQMASPQNLGYKVGGFSFDDTDVYKTIEGASYLLQTYPDATLEAYIDSVLAIVAAAQESDGYLYTARTMNPLHPHGWAGQERWSQVEVLSHEFYNLGHMVEGAVAHYQATGKRNFLDIAIRYADCVINNIGEGEGKLIRVPGHQIAEMALCKLYTVTGEKKYLDQAKFFLDYRGRTSRKDEYSQAHLPVTEQDEAVGHAVRATYMYSGMADVAALTGDSKYTEAVDRIWENMVTRKMYLTGGIGSTANGEAFGKNYELPNRTSYCETCAAIGNVYVNYRMFLLHGDSKYYDVLERALYNGVISGVSLSGDGFFYPNPLESGGEHERKEWFGCACCPSNICRFIPSVPGYVYAVKDDDLYVNLFMSNTMTTSILGKEVTLVQKSGYPWNGDTEISIDRTSVRKEFTIKVRIPSWLRGNPLPGDLYSYADGKTMHYNVKVNGERVPCEVGEDGYASVSRKWKKGDTLSIHFDMEPRIVKANDKVEADRGRIAVEKGPIVYCAEWPDNDFNVRETVLPARPSEMKSIHREDLLRGVDCISAPAQNMTSEVDGRLALKDVTLTLIPYYAWCQRGRGDMIVWLPSGSLSYPAAK